VIVRFVDIGGVVDHHCLNFLFINSWEAWSVQKCRKTCLNSLGTCQKYLPMQLPENLKRTTIPLTDIEELVT